MFNGQILRQLIANAGLTKKEFEKQMFGSKSTASTSALKEGTLETGAKIMVPLFINQDDVIPVNTTDRSYGQRV